MCGERVGAGAEAAGESALDGSGAWSARAFEGWEVAVAVIGDEDGGAGIFEGHAFPPGG